MLKMNAEFSNMATRWACCLCDGDTSRSHYVVSIVDDDNDEIASFVCESCMDAGPEGAADRMRAQAARLRQRAAALDSIASEVAAIAPDAWVTVEQAREVVSDYLARMDDELSPGDRLLLA